MTLEERREILASIARGEMPEERMGKEGPYTVPTSNRDRLAALKMLGELDGDFERAKKAAVPKTDEYASMSDRQLELALQEEDT